MSKSKWKKKVHGKTLRGFIKDDEPKGIEIVKELRRLTLKLSKSKDDYQNSDFEDLYLLLDGEDKIIEECRENNNWEEYSFEDEDELTDERLTTFYDLCDEYDVLVKLS